MDLILNLATTFWQWSIFVALVIIGYNWDNYNEDGEKVEVVYSKDDQRDSDALEELHNKLKEAYKNA